MATITTRSGKGSALTHTELDNNFSNLNSDKVEASGDTITGNLNFQDNAKAQFGNSNDLQIYHDGSDSFIVDQGTGNLAIRASSSLYLQSAAGSTYFQGVSGGASTLYHSGSSKLATTSTGIDVTGTVSADGLSVNSGATNQGAYFVSTDSGQTIALSDSASSNLLITDSNGFNILTNGDANSAGSNATRAARFKPNKDVEFYEDTGTTAKLTWSASTESLTVGSTQLNFNGAKVQTGDGSTASAGFNVFTSSTGDGYLLFSDGNVGNQAYTGQIRYNHASDFMTFGTNGGAERMRIDSSGNVGIGTSLPGSALEVVGRIATSGGSADIQSTLFGAGDGSAANPSIRNIGDSDTGFWFPAANTIGFSTAGSERVRIDSSGRVGINTTSALDPLEVNGNIRTSIGSGGHVTAYESDGTRNNHIRVGSDSSGSFIRTSYSTGGSFDLRFLQASTERMRIDSSGNLLVGKTAENTSQSDGVEARADGRLYSTTDGTTVAKFNRRTSDGPIVDFRKNNTVVGKIGVTLADNMFLAGNSSHVGIAFGGGTVYGVDSTGAIDDGNVDLGSVSGRFKDLYLSNQAYASYYGSSGDTDTFMRFAGSNITLWENGGTEAMRIDASGNLLLGTTTTTPGVGNTDAGASVRRLNGAFFSRTSATPLHVNRSTNDGTIVDFRKDGANVGSIGTVFGNLTIGTTDTGVRFTNGDSTIRPWNLSTNAVRDNAINLGAPAGGFKDLYLSGGAYLGGTAAANKLDDYEEGTWSPTISGVNGLTVGASPSYSATYTKIGRLVYFTVLLDFDSTDTVDVGDRFLVSNLPFTRNSAIETITGVGTAVTYTSYGTNVLAQGTVGLDNSTVISVVITNVSGSPTHASGTRLSGTYIAA